jgi:drug/metabolite transporter (DMT)-like permease
VPVLLMQRPRIDATDWPLVLLAVCSVCRSSFLLQFEGLAQTTVTHASLMVAGMPILPRDAAAIIARERGDDQELDVSHRVRIGRVV